MKKIGLLLFWLTTIYPSRGFAEPVSAPEGLMDAYKRMRAEFDLPPTYLRVELARIARSTPHPPESASDFETDSAVIIWLNPSSYGGEVSSVFHKLVEAAWKPDAKSLPGLAKLRVRVIAPKKEVLLELYIRERWSTVYYNGTWYTVDRQATEAFISSLTEWAKESLEPAP